MPTIQLPAEFLEGKLCFGAFNEQGRPMEGTYFYDQKDRSEVPVICRCQHMRNSTKCALNNQICPIQGANFYNTDFDGKGHLEVKRARG